jgi:hypothetical protein
MDFSYTTELAIPVVQIGLLLLLSTGALLFRRIRLALMTNYLFTLYWGYVLNRDIFGSTESLGTFTLVYFGFGVAIVMLAAIGLFVHSDQYGS